MKTNENGRSMIEMLGVLAIIGVLSVGGIYGYTVAMRSYRANEIAQTMSMLATMAHAADAGNGRTLTLQESGLETSPAGVALNPTTTVATCSQNDNCATVTVTLNYQTPASVPGGEANLSRKIGSLLPTNAAVSGYTWDTVGTYSKPAASGSSGS